MSQDKSFLGQTPAGRSRGLFETPLGQEEPVLTHSTSDMWNVSAAPSLGGTASKTPGSKWFPNRSVLAVDQPSPAMLRTGRGSHVLKRRSGIEKLKKSMSELDEVVASPGSQLHLSMAASSYTPGSLLKGSLFNQSLNLPSEMETPPSRRIAMEKLATPQFTPKHASLSIMDETGVAREMLLEDTPRINQTTFLSFDGNRTDDYGNRTDDYGNWTEDYGNRTEDAFLDTSRFSTAPESKLLEDPEKVGRNLVRAFHESFSSHHRQGDVLELVASLQQVCENQVKKLTEMAKGDLYAQLMVDLNLERSTWELIRALYSDRVDADNMLGGSDSDEDGSMITDLMSTGQTEKELAGEFFNKDSSVRQAQVVVDWLEDNAHSNLTQFPQKIHHYADEVVWENTLHKLRQQDSDITSRDHMITEMDPDAPARQGRSLAELDAKDEQSLVKHLFMYVRAGQLTQAQELCTRCGQPWRAASLEGWKLAHDPNYGKNLDTDHLEPTEGNRTRDLWKLACWEMAGDPAYNSYEKALYAALAGDVKNILPVCSSWCDCVWAYFKVLVDVKTEKKLRACSPSTGQSLESLPTEYWNSLLVPELVFQEIEANISEVIRDESCNHFHLTQKLIILGDLEDLIRTIHSWFDDNPGINQLRFMAHLVLFVKGLGLLIEDEKCSQIMEAYVQELIGKEYYSMVALYTAQLPSELQISCYTNLLRVISDPKEQRTCLDLGKRAGLDIATITKSVVEQIRNVGVDVTLDGPALELGKEVELTKVDLSKIEVIKWLVFEEAQRAEAIIQGNALMRQFLACRKLKAARAVFSKLPLDSVEVVTRHWQGQEGDRPLPPHLENSILEYHCIQAYLDANDSFNAWFHHYHDQKPAPPAEPSRADFRANVEYQQRLEQYKVDESSWNSSLRYLTEKVETKLNNVLLFGEWGWMVDSPEPAGSVDELRARQMRLLRETCIPQVCFLLLTVFNSTKQFSKSLRLADVIASEEYLLYQLFRQHELEKLLSLIHKSALCTVDDRKSELGYPIS